jgi:hypothetical protein
MPRLRMKGAKPLFPLYALKPWTVKILLYLYQFRYLGLKNEHHNYPGLQRELPAPREAIFAQIMTRDLKPDAAGTHLCVTFVQH